MCASDDLNGTMAVAKPIPAPALAAVLILIAAGIVLVALYGKSQKRAWAPQQTYSFTPDPTDSGTTSVQCGETVLLASESYGGPDGVTGLDDTLEEHLIPESEENDAPLNLRKP